jgi:hypothetical protein
MANDIIYDETYECSICYNTYNENINLPKIIPCGHTFCSSCIEQNSKHERGNKINFNCFKCRKEKIFKNNDLRINLILLPNIALTKNIKKVKKIIKPIIRND